MSTGITDAEVLEFIARTDIFYPPNAVEHTIADQRRFYDEMCDAFRQPRPAGVTVTNETIDGPGGAISQRRYVPENARPVTVVYFHGGGFIVGGLESHDDVCAEIAAATGCPVISVDYRLSPEHIHPAAYDDSLAAARAALAKGPVILAGDSAGGNLAAAVAQTLRGAAIRGQVLIYPGLGGEGVGLPSYTECAEVPMLPTRDIRYYRTIRSGGPVPEDDPTFSPLVASDLGGLAPCFISAAGVDPLRDDGVEYDRRLVGAGVTAYCVVEPQLPHGHLRARTMSHRARDAFGRILDAIREFAA
ncbi:MAG: alpha/beta hydrolase [Paracoccaceae bacterium]